MSGTCSDNEPVLVTGASGFVGSAVARALVADGHDVRLFLEPGCDVSNLEGLAVDRITGDVRDSDAVAEAVKGVATIFHLAAIYRFWVDDQRHFYDVNVGGTINLLRAAEKDGCARFIYTSTVATLGVAHAGKLASEDSVVRFEHLFGHYKRSKYLAEHEVLRAGASGLPVVLVHPTFPVGERDNAPTPTGRTIVEYLNGRIPAYVDTALNVVHVDDVARGHVLAAKHGQPGRSYILGGENMSLQQMFRVLAELRGTRPPKLRLSPRAVLPIVRAAEWVEERVLRREPTLPSEPVRMATTRMEYDDHRARHELGYTSIPAADALRRAVTWYVEHGFVAPSPAERIRRATGLQPEVGPRLTLPELESDRSTVARTQ